MPPFSNKKKKHQLQLKRQRKRERVDDPSAFYRTIMQKTHHRGRPIGNGGQQKGSKDSLSGDGRKERFADLQFFRDSDEEIRLRKEQSMLPIVPLEDGQLEVDAAAYEASLDVPKRPSWNKSFTKVQLDRQEQIYFKNFVDKLLEQTSVTDKKLSYFDLNLDTWRQLWRVLEMSEIVTIIVDIRHPLFHFPPALYRYIVEDLRKEVIIVLNKVDLVPAPLVIAWQSYLKSQYPEVHIIPFASYAGVRTKKNGKRVGLLHMATDGARRFMLEVEKVVGTGTIDFSSWREKIQQDCKKTLPPADVAATPSSESDNEHVPAKSDGDETPSDSEPEQSDAQEDDQPGSDTKKKSDTAKRHGGRAQSNLSVSDHDEDDEDEEVGTGNDDGDDGDDHDDDDDDDDDEEFGAKALRKAAQIKVKNDTTFYKAEKYKDGILTIGCVGHPNVGKSSFMNALIGKKVVSVSRTPGHTKHFQTIFLTPNIRLCDCPGLVFPSLYPKQLQVLMGCYPISQLREPYSSIQYLAERVDMVRKLKLRPADVLLDSKPALNDKNYAPARVVSKDGSQVRAGTSGEWSAFSICESWAVMRGFLTARSGRPDVYRAANHMLRMALDGRTLCMSFYPPDYLSQKQSHWEEHEDIEHICRIQGRHNIIDENDDGY